MRSPFVHICRSTQNTKKCNVRNVILYNHNNNAKKSNSRFYKHDCTNSLKA